MKAVIFDFDYTLGDSTNGIVLSVNYAMEQLGHKAQTVDNIRKTIGLSLENTYRQLTGRSDSGEESEFAVLFKKKADEVMVANANLYSGSKSVLHKLKESGCKTGIVTTKYRCRIEQILKKSEATELVDIIVGSDDVKAEKPSPEGMIRAMELLGVSPDEVIYVGDSVVDARTAENSGVGFVGVLTGTTTRNELEKYECIAVCDDISAAYELIRKII